MSDSDYDYEYEYKTHCKLQRHQLTTACSGIFEKWSRIPVDTKIQASHLMKVCTFWLPILLQRQASSLSGYWALQIGLIDSSEDITMKQLHKIETVEAILRAMETGTLKNDQTKHVFWISQMFYARAPEAFEDALQWLERTGEPGIRDRVLELGHEFTRFTALQHVFTEYAIYINDMSDNLEKTMRELMAKPPDHQVAKSEEMKTKGNQSFQKQHYDEAVRFYSKALKFYPHNHIIYGNRALCYIRSKKYLKAVGDGKRATLIKPRWPKGHYRYCEALFKLGYVDEAILANDLAQSLCCMDQDGARDLAQQGQKFLEHENVPPKKSSNKRTNAAEPRPQTAKPFNAATPSQPPPQITTTTTTTTTTRATTKGATGAAPQNKVSNAKPDKPPAKNENIVQAAANTKDSKPSKNDLPAKNGNASKKKTKNNNTPTEKQTQKVDDAGAAVCKELKSLVQEAHSALTDLRLRNADQAFSQALVLLETTTTKDIGLSKLDVLLLLFGRASALTEIGQPEELSQAQNLLEKMDSFEERTFQCLVFYGIGKVHLKENRFAVALGKFSDSLQMVENQITPGKLTWPLTKEIVKETDPEYFKEILESDIELCRFPPPPAAICRLDKCLSPFKAEIYLKDPDFKGYIQFICSQSCVVEYHSACWKTLKATSFSQKNEKDFLQDPCWTPDCVGQICSIKIIGPTGLQKCKFEAPVPKPQTPKKTKVNQKCTSLKNLKSKEDRRLKRKQKRRSFQEKQAMNDETLQQKEDSASHTQQKSWLLYRDRVLLQISQNLELLKQETVLQVSTLSDGLKPWLELDQSRGNPLAGRILNWEQGQLLTLSQAVEVLLERRNRVWARVFIQILSGCQGLNPKLNKWACQLNSAGLNAAKTFVERYSGRLEQLDLSILLNFGPLQDVIIEKLGTRPELFSSIGLTVTDYLKQAPPDDMRLFIWTLEEHRDQYVACGTILDEYFDMMDGHCSVLKKSDDNQNNSPMKNRGRKKKQREPRGEFALSSTRSVTPRDEWDQDYFEDDSLSFLDPGEPFSVPSHLRDQVADFEDQFNGTRHRSHYKNILDNNPDPTKESLYDYFAQILEEHGPLVAEDPLLVGELVNFPLEARQKIQEAGGFAAFLLESLRFIKMGRCIGLAKHAVSLQQSGHGASLDHLDSLDDLDEIADPDTNYPSSSDLQLDQNHAFLTPPDAPFFVNPVYPILPSPYATGPLPPPAASVGPYATNSVPLTGRGLFYHWNETPSFDPDDHEEEQDLYTEGDFAFSDSLSDGGAAMATEGSSCKKHAAIQTSPEAMRSVAVNTEHHEPFETYQGGITSKQKEVDFLERENERVGVVTEIAYVSFTSDMEELREDVQKIRANVQVTNTELSLFQEKLEEEVKKDQREKKANQEVLKALKVEKEELVEEQKSLSQNIQEKKTSYEEMLNNFLEQSHQSAAERMSLEDEINRCKASFNSAIRRSQNAQLSLVESKRDQGLIGLHREITNAKALLRKLDEVAHRFPNQDMEITRNTWRAKIQEMEKKITTAEAQFQEQKDQVKKGQRFNELLPVNISHQSESAATPLPAAVAPPAASAMAPPQQQHKPPVRTGTPHGNTVFDRAMEQLSTMFPDYTRPELKRFVQELRASNGGSLSNMALQDMVGGVTQIILDHQEGLNSKQASGGPTQHVTPVWQPVPPIKATLGDSDALNLEDPCIICHDDMSPHDICVLECRHSFHRECIKSWLKEQSTCPTCREHALLPDDFPALHGRRRP